ncbi:MAG TPA: CAP domain-containing protein [Pyrinomonadaceae bacterium]|nr:CAP domain-containing protein [Pyrinomonadaceae bacterium]
MKFFFAESKIFVLTIAVMVVVSAFNNNAFSQNNKKNNSKETSSTKISDNFDSYTFRIFTLINAERIKSRLIELSWDDDVAKIAVEYSKKMAKENFFGHFDSDGRNVLERAKSAKLRDWSKIGENLFSIEQTEKFDGFAVKNWMKSLTHRQNILDPEWTATGIGIGESKDGEIFITQVFIKR